jgi:pimeloyl-ACP methyl ester carboxylesterase
MDLPVTRYARNADGQSIAYQVLGDGPHDLLFVPGFISHVELFWSEPSVAHFYRRLASFSRLILFDKRGTGLSDPVPGPLPLEDRLSDVRAVLDAAGSERASLVGVSEGSAMAAVFAAAHPERTRHLVMCGSILGGDPAAHPAAERWRDSAGRFLAALERWGEGAALRLVAPGAPMSDAELGRLERAGASPAMARALIAMWMDIDLRDVLPSIGVPTLVLHRRDEIFPVEAAREVAGRIPGARMVELAGRDHAPWFGDDTERYAAEIEEFVTGVRERRRADRVLATVLVTDIVGSTERAAALGDPAWRRLMARHDALVRSHLHRYAGTEVKHTGDGFLALFDGPARAIRCARALTEAAEQELGMAIRAGAHTGEVELVDSDVRGLAVHLAARVAAKAGAGEVLVSSTVKELVLGSEIEFAPHGEHDLKGVPGRWRIFAAAGTRTPARA